MYRDVTFTRINGTVSISNNKCLLNQLTSSWRYWIESNFLFYSTLINLWWLLLKKVQMCGNISHWIQESRHHDIIDSQCCQSKLNTQWVSYKQFIGGNETNNETIGYRQMSEAKVWFPLFVLKCLNKWNGRKNTADCVFVLL